MRITIDVDDQLLKRAQRACGASTKKATIAAALRLLLDVEGQKSIRRLRGKVGWDGDLKMLRRTRSFPKS